MNYEFPHDVSLDEVRAVVAQHNENLGVQAFIEADRGEYVIFNYIISFPESFPNPLMDDGTTNRDYAILRECRGLTFHKNGRLIRRPYHKFFNVGQKDETQVGVIDWAQDHHILEKLDGSMIVPMFVGDDLHDISPEKLVWTTKMGETDVAAMVHSFLETHPNHATYSAHVIYSGYTPIFEFCSRKQKIVVDYPEDRLVLTAIRNNKTGEYHSYEDLSKARTHYIDVVNSLGSITNIDQFLQETRDLEGGEGNVTRFASGHMVKAKGLWYLQLHGTIDILASEKSIVSLIAWDTIDDAMGFMSDEDRASVEAFMTAYEAGIAATAADIVSIVESLKAATDGTPKEFAKAVMSNTYPAEYQRMLFSVGKGADAATEIRKVIANFAHPTAGTATRIDAARHLFGGIHWEDFRTRVIPVDDD